MAFVDGNSNLCQTRAIARLPFDDFRCHLTYPNRMPAVVNYIRRPGEQLHRAFAVDVLRIEGGMIADITAFGLENQLDAFALPESLP